MKILLLEPGKLARKAYIDHTLQAMQALVGGCIQATYPFEESVALVCNEEGLLPGLPLNRRINKHTLIAGTFFLCGLSEDDFTDLPPELMERFKRRFLLPECFVRLDGEILAVPYDPRG